MPVPVLACGLGGDKSGACTEDRCGSGQRSQILLTKIRVLYFVFRAQEGGGGFKGWQGIGRKEIGGRK